jgi:hypothetical protein
LKEAMPALPATFERYRDLAIYWYNKSSDLRGSAGALWISQEETLSAAIVEKLNLAQGFRLDAATPLVYRMLCGMSLELLYKAILVARQQQIPHTHDLVKLAKRADVAVGTDESALLQILTESIVWDGRYPVPKTFESFDNLQNLKSKHLFKSEPFGKHGRVRRSNGALNWDGFNGLWTVANDVFWKHYTQ